MMTLFPVPIPSLSGRFLASSWLDLDDRHHHCLRLFPPRRTRLLEFALAYLRSRLPA